MVSETYSGGLRWVASGTAPTHFLSAGDASCISIQGYVVGVSLTCLSFGCISLVGRGVLRDLGG